MIVFSTSITPYSIAIRVDPRVRLGPRFFSSPWDRSIIVSIFTPTSSIVSIVSFISIPTLTSVSKSPLGHFVCNLVSYYLIYCNSDNYCSYHLTYDCSICLLIYFYNLAYNCFYCCNSLYYHLDVFLY